MKRFCYSFAGVLSVILFFSVCYYVSFQNTIEKMEEKKKHSVEIPEILSEAMEERLDSHEAVDSTKTAEAAADDAIITSDTVCVYEIIYLDSDSSMCYEAKPTAEIAGLNRIQLRNKLKKYIDNMPVTEYEEGLISYELLSFSPERVVMQKVYDQNKVRYKYYVTVKNKEVVVYYSDRKTVFEYTGISCESLEDDIEIALEIGIPINDIESLYDYLSGITS